MSTSGALKPTKRAKKVIKDLEFIKNNYLDYLLIPGSKERREINEMIQHIEDYIAELSADKRTVEASIAQKIKNG